MLRFLEKEEKGCQVLLTCCCSVPIAYMEVSVMSAGGMHGSGCTSRVAHEKLTLHSSKDFWSSGTRLKGHCCGPHSLASTYFALLPDQKLIAGLEMCCGRLPHHHLQCSFWAFSTSIAILCITPQQAVFCPEGGVNKILQDIGNDIPECKMPCPRRQ